MKQNVEQFELGAGGRGTKISLALEADIGLDQALTFPVLQVIGAKEGRTLLILSSVHGDEYEGVETVLRVYAELDPALMTGTVVLVPLANPLAYAGESRISPEDGVNMARAFPGNPHGTPTERIADYLHRRFIAKAGFLLDLHSGGTHYAVCSLVGYYDNEQSEVGRSSRAAAEAFGAELLWAHDRIAPGRTVSSALELGVPWLYTEAYGGKRIRREDAELFLAGTYRVMRHLGVLPQQALASEAEPLGRVRRIGGDGNFDGSETAEEDGFFLPCARLGDELTAGQTIGSIRSLDGRELQRVEASRDGLLVMLRGTPTVKRGEALFLIAPLLGGR